MNEIIISFLKTNAGPVVFISVAAILCYLLPAENRSEAIYLVIGAALTRVKRTDT